MKKKEKIVWNPIVARLANASVKQNDSSAMETSYEESEKIKSNWVSASKRRSPEEFKEYIHELFDDDSNKVKYQNPDLWNVYPSKKKRN